MHRYAVLALVFATGCQIENDLTIEYPDLKLSEPVPPPEVSQTDVIVQVTTPKVDVLWTIDNSCSMFDEQEELKDSFPSFMSYFTDSGLDYHVGVVSTDLDNSSDQGKLRSAGGVTFIEEDTPNPVSVFAAMATLGISGSPNEKGLGATYLAIEVHADDENLGFYREEAAMHTVVISDENDQTQASLISQNEFVGWYGGLKREADQRTFSSIVSPPGGGAFDGSAYLATTAAIGGITWDINDPDYRVVLDRLGVQASGLKREYFLSQQPVPGTIGVEVVDPSGAQFTFDEVVLDAEGVRIDGDWSYEQARNSIIFAEYVPEALARVVLTYDVLSANEIAADDL